MISIGPVAGPAWVFDRLGNRKGFWSRSVRANAVAAAFAFPALARRPVTGVLISNFASACGMLLSEFRNRRDTGKFMILVRFWI
jgi:hypothetical protein